MVNNGIERAIIALPPQVTVTPILDEEATLQADSIVALHQADLHHAVHGVAAKVMSDIIDSLPRDKEGRIQLSEDQLRGCLAKAAIKSSIITALAIGNNLSEAEGLNSQLSISGSPSDPARSE